MNDTDPMPDRSPPTLRTSVLASLAAGGVAGAAAFALLGALTGAPNAATVGAPAVPPSAESVDRMAEREPGADVVAAPGSSELEDLRDALALAEAERSQLAGSVLALNRRAEELETRLQTLAAAPAADGAAEGALPSGADGDVVIAGEQGAGDTPPVDSFVAAGLDPQTAADIRARRDAFSLARLELIDRAAREGWDESDRLDEALEALEARRPDLREELGDEAYDRYLFEEGRSNRVGIASVISGSAAADAGLAPGDVVLSYAGSRVFRLPELQAATREGTLGEYVQLSVLRGGDVVAIDVPRGPLGVTLDGVRRSPP